MEEKMFIEGPLGNICMVLERQDVSQEMIIFVHGFSSNKDKGSKSISHALADLGFATCRIDLDNRGESDLDFETGFSLKNYLKQLETVYNYVKELGYGEVSLLGTSYGGLVVQAFTLTHPEIKRLCLRCPVFSTKRNMIKRYGEEKFASFEKNGFVEYKNSEGEILTVPYENFKTSLDYDMTERAKELSMPILIVQGDLDDMVDFKLAQETTKSYNNAKIHILKGAGHDMKIKGTGKEMIQVIQDFFKEDL
jgi:pimeloyl-ACP methyl ester carboxylesterase